MSAALDPGTIEDRLLIEAADWMVLLMSREMSDADATRLVQWRAQSSAHDAAFREIAGVSDYARAAQQHGKPVDRRAILAGGGVALAAAFGFGIARPPLGLWPSYAELAADHRTPKGGRLAWQPAQGVQVELSSRTAASMIGDGTGLRLVHGEGYLSTALNAAAFLVEMGAFTLSAQGASFNLQALDTLQRVSCVHGTVHCAIGDQRIALHAGQELKRAADGTLHRATANRTNAAAWRRGMLVFEGSPLADVIDQLNLYTSRRILLRNASASTTPLSAVFHLESIDAAVRQIGTLLGLKVRDLAGLVVLE